MGNARASGHVTIPNTGNARTLPESLVSGVFGTSRQVLAVLGMRRDLEVTEHAVMAAPSRFGKRTVCLSVFWSILSMSS